MATSRISGLGARGKQKLPNTGTTKAKAKANAECSAKDRGPEPPTQRHMTTSDRKAGLLALKPIRAANGQRE